MGWFGSWSTFTMDMDEYTGLLQDSAKAITGKRPRSKAEAKAIVEKYLEELKGWGEALGFVLEVLDTINAADLKSLCAEKTDERPGSKEKACMVLGEFYVEKAGGNYEEALRELTRAERSDESEDDGPRRRGTSQEPSRKSAASRADTNDREHDEAEEDDDFVASLAPSQREVVIVTENIETGGLLGTLRSAMKAVRDVASGRLPFGENGVARITPHEAHDLFKFPHGHPIIGSAYVLHPIYPERYLVPTDVNTEMALQKMGAFKVIVAALGATRVEILSVDSTSSQTQAGVDVTLAARQVGLQGYVAHDGTISRHSSLELHDPPPEPSIPEDMKRWLTDPNIGSLARIMQTRRSGEETMVLDIKNDYDVETKMSKLGGSVKIGGQIKRAVSCIWKFRVRWGMPASAAPQPATAVPTAVPAPAQASSAFCTSCGARALAGTRFCGTCGTPIGGPAS